MISVTSDCGMTVDAGHAGLSISGTDFLGFTHRIVSRVWSEWSKKNKKTSDEQQFCLVDVC